MTIDHEKEEEGRNNEGSSEGPGEAEHNQKKKKNSYNLSNWSVTCLVVIFISMLL